MKTEKIIQCIEWSAGSPRMKIKAKAELAALEADNAAMREKTIEECVKVCLNLHNSMIEAGNIACSNGATHCITAIRALTPDSGKVQP